MAFEPQLHLFSPLISTAGRSLVKVPFEGAAGPATLPAVIDALVEEVGTHFRRHLYGLDERIIPSWKLFFGSRPVRLNRAVNLATPVGESDELAFVLNTAGGWTCEESEVLFHSPWTGGSCTK